MHKATDVDSSSRMFIDNLKERGVGVREVVCEIT